MCLGGDHSDFVLARAGRDDVEQLGRQRPPDRDRFLDRAV